MIAGRELTNRAIRSRELSDRAVSELARGLADYIRKPGNRGGSFLLDSKGLRPADRAAVLAALGDLQLHPSGVIEEGVA